ncbi:prolyl oligopeptidase family serine peptidase [Sphingomonas sp. MAH-20]|uniref:Prolyl oligopeptidase family serine peptidase n=1 Tax=Sphingomonas horti TaxID=2682842 RepID=A0A6I4IXL1_9SPHN|nr:MULTISPECIES: prolyl oligopeptidase family serine peptidase [Sphingomonas]MBA2920888.1 S9 family peptidase [Sphingomonas sp. CGMCC 1.13658]MVO76874.1 prolyl oligopeptidase family serine peptidase [Sphingomonas horti]
MRKVVLAAALMASAALAQGQVAPKPEALTADGIPPVPQALVEKTRPYLEFRSGVFNGWNPRTKSALIITRFGNTPQLHEVASPLGMRRQISFEADTIAGATAARNRGDVVVVQKDVGGSEFWQLYTLANGRLTLITDGKSRNELNAWSHDGRWLAYSSTRRTGTDSDLYVIDPRDPKTDRMVAAVKGGGWGIADFAPDGKTAVVLNYISVNKVDPYLLDLASGTMTPIGDHKQTIAYGEAEFAPDGTLWVTSDQGSDFQRLGTLDPKSGRFTPVAAGENWDVDTFDIAPDGRFVAYIVNEAGVSRLKLLDTASKSARTVTALPQGVASTLQVAPWGTIGLTVSSARASADMYAVDPQTLAVTRWTQSETGGLDVSANREPELVKVKSFDGLEVSGFLYRPDPAKFPGKRPLLVNIHGGPEGQSRPGFLGRNNYYLNELGIAIFYPNVRGSTGFGKTFVAADNGPFKREDSVKDIGAFLDVLAKDPALDAAHFGVTGGSYGGYMCYASAIRYGDRFKAANCVVAISNFVTFLENTQGYRRDLRRVEYGDERDARQRAQLLAISPLTHVGQLKIPLFVVTGGNDPRVPASEAEQMVAAVRKNGQTAWHLLAADEGHGYSKKANQDYQMWTTLMFWERNLLGTR